MRRLWWVGLCGAFLMLTACEQDEGDGDVGGSDAGGDVSDDTGLEPLCVDDENFQNSCLSEFFACHDAAGTCTVETRTAVGDTQVMAVVWTSGSEYVVRYDNVSTQRDEQAFNSSGAVCASTTANQGPDGERTMGFSQSGGNDTVTMEVDGSGNMVVTCPNGDEEVFSQSERYVFLQCLGMTCTEGDELFVEE